MNTQPLMVIDDRPPGSRLSERYPYRCAVARPMINLLAILCFIGLTWLGGNQLADLGTIPMPGRWVGILACLAFVGAGAMVIDLWRTMGRLWWLRKAPARLEAASDVAVRRVAQERERIRAQRQD